MTAEFLDTMVRLASAGASGISIFAIFWIGWLLLRLPSDASSERHKTLRHFMLTCVAIAVIAGATGLVNAKFNANENSILQGQIAANNEKIRSFETLQATARGVVKTLKFIVRSKEIAAAASGSRELQGQVKVIHDAIQELTSILEDAG